MLKIINDLKYFFEDASRKISVREYGRLLGVSAPTASKLLEEYAREKLLVREEWRNFIFYTANDKDLVFKDLERIYLREKGKKKEGKKRKR